MEIESKFIRELTWDEITRLRSIPRLVAWTEKLFEVIRSDETDRSRADFRLSDYRPAKLFRDEILPFRAFAEQMLTDPAIQVQFKADHHKGDALIFGLKEREPQVVEIVRAIDGYEERLRMEKLTKEGTAPGYGPIHRDKSDPGAAKIFAYGIMDSVDRHAAREAVKVLDRIRAKAKKGYDPGTWLLVAFDDGRVFKERHYDMVYEIAREAASHTDFERIYIVGPLGHKFCRQVWPSQ